MLVLKVINRGGFGRVEEVRLVGEDRVARKVFDPQPGIVQASRIDKLKKRFEREARVQASLDKDYFMPILESDLEGDIPWFTMPLAERNLREEIDEARLEKRVPDGALADILNSLEQLHELGYVHRDLKPQNVLYHESRNKRSRTLEVVYFYAQPGRYGSRFRICV